MIYENIELSGKYVWSDVIEVLLEVVDDTAHMEKTFKDGFSLLKTKVLPQNPSDSSINYAFYGAFHPFRNSYNLLYHEPNKQDINK